jgi:hypothetical protein
MKLSTKYMLQTVFCAVCALVQFVAILAMLSCFAGCGDDTPALRIDTAPWPECKPTPGYVHFNMETCAGYGDVGICRWEFDDGRDVQWDHCYTQAGTCLRTCDEIKPQ